MRVGSILTGKMVIYPFVDNVDGNGNGNQLINWMAEIKRETYQPNDWNKPGDLADFFPRYQSWHFDWLDVAQMIRDADQILEYPMVDTDPLERWTFDHVTLAGDAAHPMYPRGSNGAAQAAIDARTSPIFCAAAATCAMRLRPTRRRAWPRRRAWYAPTESIRPTSSTLRSSGWSATSRSRTSTNTSVTTSCAPCRRTTSASPASRRPTTGWVGVDNPKISIRNRPPSRTPGCKTTIIQYLNVDRGSQSGARRLSPLAQDSPLWRVD
jgi:hypothetical protein